MDFQRRYREVAPSRPLRPFVDCYWWSEVQAPGGCTHAHRVLPDGCIDILFELVPRLQAGVIGAMTRALVVIGEGPTRMVAARFRPGGAHAFFPRPLHEWTDSRIDLGEAWPQDRTFGERLAEAGFPRGAVQILDRHLRGRLAATERPGESLGAGLLWLWNHRPPLSVREAAAKLGYTRQHLTRRYKAETGLGPKQLQRIARLQRALAEARTATAPRSWARLALEAGYCDQAHLIGECRALTGCTPVQLMA